MQPAGGVVYILISPTMQLMLGSCMTWEAAASPQGGVTAIMRENLQFGLKQKWMTNYLKRKVFCYMFSDFDAFMFFNCFSSKRVAVNLNKELNCTEGFYTTWQKAKSTSKSQTNTEKHLSIQFVISAYSKSNSEKQHQN
jgi:hypothetical protein